jgi:hypothetical protein
VCVHIRVCVVHFHFSNEDDFSQRVSPLTATSLDFCPIVESTRVDPNDQQVIRTTTKNTKRKLNILIIRNLN